mmetsp:Transcript_19014/g.44303  ORF Transcript_19014/g.44303 Transcript_19014/m.44303 type:complete len:218 (-) Transcript_19014:925-1578(-)
MCQRSRPPQAEICQNDCVWACRAGSSCHGGGGVRCGTEVVLTRNSMFPGFWRISWLVTSQQILSTMLRFALASGWLAATVSCVAKFVMSYEIHLELQTWLCAPNGNVCQNLVHRVSQGMGLCIVVGLNLLMFQFFLKGMEESGSVAATGLSSAAQLGASAFYGFLFFDERSTLLNGTWLFGFLLLFLGVALLSTVNLVEDKTESKPLESEETTKKHK